MEDEEWGCQLLRKRRRLSRRPRHRAAPRCAATGSNSRFLSSCRGDPTVPPPAGGGRCRDSCRRSSLHPCSPAPQDTRLPEPDLINVLKTLWTEIVGNTEVLLQPRLFSNSWYLRNKLHVSCSYPTAGEVPALLDTRKDTHPTQTAVGVPCTCWVRHIAAAAQLG